MSKLLVDLLDVEERPFLRYIDRLEKVCLHPSIDIRLATEVSLAAKRKSEELGVKPDDPKALYDSLFDRAASHDLLLQKKLRIADTSNLDLVAKRLAMTVNALSKKENALHLSSAAAKQLLKACPPSKTLRLLKLRSIDAVMKRFDPRMIYAVACHIETKSWTSQIHAKMKRISDKDILWSQVEAIHLPQKWYEKLSPAMQTGGFYTVNRESGLLVIYPVVNPNRSGSTLLALSLLLQSTHRLAMDSMPYKRRSFLKGAHSVLPEIAHGVQPTLTHIHGLLPTWPVVYRLLGQANSLTAADQETDVDLLLDDLQWESVESKLTRLQPELGFWLNTHFLAVRSPYGPLSMHLVDVASSLVSGRGIGNHRSEHMESSLWNELQLRYLNERALEKALMNQLMSTEELVIY